MNAAINEETVMLSEEEEEEEFDSEIKMPNGLSTTNK